MSSELELLRTAISHLKEDVKELQTDHEWCVKMNEAVEKSYIPIPRINLSQPCKFYLQFYSGSATANQQYTINKTKTYTLSRTQTNTVLNISYKSCVILSIVIAGNKTTILPCVIDKLDYNNTPYNINYYNQNQNGITIPIHTYISFVDVPTYYTIIPFSDFKNSTNQELEFVGVKKLDNNNKLSYDNLFKNYTYIYTLGLSENSFAETSFNTLYQYNGSILSNISNTIVPTDNIIIHRMLGMNYNSKIFIANDD